MTPNRTRTGLFETPRGQARSEPGFGGAPLATANSDVSRSKALLTPKIKRLVRPAVKSDGSSLPPVRTPGSSLAKSSGSVASIDRSPRSVTSLDKSPRSVDSKLPHYSSMKNSSPDARVMKKSELQAELDGAREELKAANEHLLYLEKEKFQALEELQDVRRQADEAYEQLTLALSAKKEAEEKIEIERFRIVELEQAGIEAARQREETWKKEVDSIRNQHALDVSALLTATKELERLKHELAMTTEAKNAATSHADDALKIAEIHAEKVGILSIEVNRLKGLLDSKLENAAKETAEHARRLEVEIDGLRDELRRTREAEKKLNEMEILVKGLKVGISDAQKAKSDVDILVIEWKKKAELLEVKVDEAVRAENVAAQSLASTIEQLEDRNAALKQAESEILCLNGMVESLDMEIAGLKEFLNQSHSHLEAAKKEILEMENTITLLQLKIKNMVEEKEEALNHNKEIASSIPILAEENSKLRHELEVTKDEVERTKKEMEGIFSASQQATVAAQESQEQLQREQAEVADALRQLDELKKSLASSEERYKASLYEAQCEVATLKKMIDGSLVESRSILSERDLKEDKYMSSIKESEEVIVETKQEMDELISKLEVSEKEATAAKEEGVLLLNRLEQATLDARSANEAADGARVESLQLKEMLLDKENALQSITQENDELRIREEVSNKKILELSALLEEAISKKERENVKDMENAMLSKSEEEDHVLESQPELTGEGLFTEDASKSDLHPEKAKVHQMEEQNEREVTVTGTQKESYNDVDDHQEESNNYLNKPSSPQKDTQPTPFTSKQSSMSGNESFDPRLEDMTPSREHPEKKKKNFLSKIFKKSSQK